MQMGVEQLLQRSDKLAAGSTDARCLPCEGVLSEGSLSEIPRLFDVSCGGSLLLTVFQDLCC